MQTMPLPKSRAVKALSTGGQSWLPPGSVKLAAQLHYEVQMNTMAQEIGAEKALSDQKLNLKYCEVIVSTGQDMIGYHKLPSTGGGGEWRHIESWFVWICHIFLPNFGH